MRPFAPLVLLLALAAAARPAPAQEPLPIRPGDRIVLIGNTFAERMQLFPHFETALSMRFARDSVTLRNLGWSGDEVALMPRPLNFGDLDTHLAEQRADLVLAFFGMNESFAGAGGLDTFRRDLGALLGRMKSQRYNGESPPRIVLVSPIAHERVERVPLDPAAHNRDLAAYTEAMRAVAAEQGVRFVDLFTPTRPLMEDPALGDLTINGIHPNDRGYQVTARLLLAALGLGAPSAASADALRRETCETRSAQRLALERAIHDKNQLFFYRWRAVNGEYIYGRRREPFGVVNFPGEMQRLEQMIRDREREIARLAGDASTTLRRSGGNGCSVAQAR